MCDSDDEGVVQAGGAEDAQRCPPHTAVENALRSNMLPRARETGQGFRLPSTQNVLKNGRRGRITTRAKVLQVL